MGSKYKEVGTITDAGINSNRFRAMDGRTDNVATRLSMLARDAAPSSTNAFLKSELEKLDPLVRTPLTTYTYAKNIPVRVGGGWVDHVSNLYANGGIAGNSEDSSVSTNGATVSSTIQVNFGKDLYKTHIFVVPMSIDEFDILRGKVTGRSLETVLTDFIRLTYEKHLDKNVFMGLSNYGTTGLLNNADVYAHAVVAGASTHTTWATKTADEILTDINNGIIETWGRSGNDMSAIPNHILLPFEQYNLLISKKVSDIGQVSIMDFLMQNNIASKHGEELVFGVSLWGKGAGAGSPATDRMAIYHMEDRFIAVEELQPLTRMYTLHDPKTRTYDTNYAANLSEVEIFYTATMSYYDGI